METITIYTCPNTGRPCEITGCNGTFCRPNTINIPPQTANSYMMGWECPRCHKIHSPFSTQCDCPQPTYTLTSTPFNVTLKNSPDQLVIGDWVTCHRTVGHIKKYGCLTEGKRYQIVDMFKHEDGTLETIFVIDNNGKKKHYDVKRKFLLNWRFN